jgi:hypothetical protein
MSQHLPRAEEFVITEILRHGLDDWIHASEVGEVLEYYGRVRDPKIGRALALQLIDKIVSDGLAIAGNVLEGTGFKAIDTVQAARDLLERSWPDAHYPKVGEIPLWLKLNDKGKSWLRERGLTWD